MIRNFLVKIYLIIHLGVGALGVLALLLSNFSQGQLALKYIFFECGKGVGVSCVALALGFVNLPFNFVYQFINLGKFLDLDSPGIFLVYSVFIYILSTFFCVGFYYGLGGLLDNLRKRFKRHDAK